MSMPPATSVAYRHAAWFQLQTRSVRSRRGSFTGASWEGCPDAQTDDSPRCRAAEQAGWTGAAAPVLTSECAKDAILLPVGLK